MNKTHPKGVRARVLLSSVFGPYAQDDEFGSRTINPMELYHNQVTKAQGSFSAAPVSPLLGHSDDPGEYLRAVRGPGFPHARGIRPRTEGPPLRHRRHLVHHRERRQGARDVPHGAGDSRRTPPSWWAATSRPFPASSTCSTPTTSSRATASRGCASTWARTSTAPIRHPALSFRLRPAGDGRARSRTRRTPPPPSSPRWDAPWAATSAPPRPSSAARGRCSISTPPARSCSG